MYITSTAFNSDLGPTIKPAPCCCCCCCYLRPAREAALAEGARLAALGARASWRRTRLAYTPPASSSSSWLPCSATCPSWMTTMRWASCTVDSLQWQGKSTMGDTVRSWAAGSRRNRQDLQVVGLEHLPEKFQ